MREKHTVWACRGAAVGIVTKLVDMETTQGVGVVAGDIPGNDGWGGLGSLLEGYGALDVRLATKDSNYKRISRLWSVPLLIFFL